jgi:hypothetical protein
MLTLFAQADPLSQYFQNIPYPQLHDNASASAQSWFFSGLLPQLLTLFTNNVGMLLLGLGIWAFLLIAGWFASNVLGAYSAAKQYNDIMGGKG